MITASIQRVSNRVGVRPGPSWVQLIPIGEWPHPATGLVQVIDHAALQSIIANSSIPILIDQDHFSYDPAKSSEAYGWIVALDSRRDGLYGRIQWTDLGELAVANGRFRRVSPVFLPQDVEQLGGNRVRPRRIDTVALTNQPNMNGDPIWNRRHDPPAATPAPTDRARAAAQVLECLARRARRIYQGLDWDSAWTVALRSNPNTAKIANRQAAESILDDGDILAALKDGSLDPRLALRIFSK